MGVMLGVLVGCSDDGGVDAGDVGVDSASDTGTGGDTAPSDTAVTPDVGGDTSITPMTCMPLIPISSATGASTDMSTPLGPRRIFWRFQLAPGFTIVELGVALAAMPADAQVTLALYSLADEAAVPSGAPLAMTTFSPAADITDPQDAMAPIGAYEVEATDPWLAVAAWSEAGSTETLLAAGYTDTVDAQTTNEDMMGSVTALPGHRLFLNGCPAP